MAEKFLRGSIGTSGPRTHYSDRFNDGYQPVVVFLTPTEARRDTIVKVAEEYWGAIYARFELRALTMSEARSTAARMLFFRALEQVEEEMGVRQREPKTVSRKSHKSK